MAIKLHHLIVPAKDKRASAQLFAEIFDLTVKPSEGRFAQVPIDEHLTINGLGFVGLSFAPNYPAAVACVMVAGFGGSFFHPSATAMVARRITACGLAPSARGRKALNRKRRLSQRIAIGFPGEPVAPLSFSAAKLKANS